MTSMQAVIAAGHRPGHRSAIVLRPSWSSASWSSASPTCGAGEPRWAPSSSSPPTASPTSATRSSRASKLDRTLGFGLVTARRSIAIALPLYWLAEPGRQADALRGYDTKFIARARPCSGRRPRGEPKAKLRALPRPQRRRAAWPKLHAAQRQRRLRPPGRLEGPGAQHRAVPLLRGEVNYILDYGRPLSPMPAWGVLGGGSARRPAAPHVIAYLSSIQLSANDAPGPGRHKEIATVCKPNAPTRHALRHGRRPVEDAGRGAVQPGRVRRLRRRRLLVRPVPHQGLVLRRHADGGGGWPFGPNLTNGSQQFPGVGAGRNQQIAFVCRGPSRASATATDMGSGQMPAFCQPATTPTPTPPEPSQRPQDRPGEPGPGMYDPGPGREPSWPTSGASVSPTSTPRHLHRSN